MRATKFAPARKKIVGIHLTRDELAAVVSLHGTGLTRVTDSFSVPVTAADIAHSFDDRQTADALRKAVAEHRLRGKPAVMSIPNNQVIVRYMQMADLPQEALKQAVEVEIGTTIHLPVEDPTVNVLRVPLIGPKEGGDPQAGVCLIAAPESVVTQMAKLARNAGLVPAAVDIQPLALMRAGGIKPGKPSELLILVQLDEAELSLSIFVGPHLYFFHNVDTGIGNTVDEPALLKSAVADIVYEINRVVNFFNFNLCEAEHPIGHVYLHTEHPKQPEIAAEIEAQLATTVSPVAEAAVSGNGEPLEATFLLALGLSMKEGLRR